MDLSFLKNVEVKEVAVKAKADRIKLEKFPIEGADFRVYKNGRIFTSEKTATEFNLEFMPKEEIIIPGKDTDDDKTKEVPTGNGLDIFSSENWQMIATPEPILFIAVVPRNGNAKIDVYGSCTYEEDGTPKRSINNNTVSTFGRDVLVPQLETLYGVNFEEVDYVDLVMNVEYAIEAPRGVFSIPKTVSRGDNKGDLVFLTRKDITVFPLTVFEKVVDVNQVDLEDSIEEVKSADVTNDKVEEPNVNNDFKIPKKSQA